MTPKDGELPGFLARSVLALLCVTVRLARAEPPRPGPAPILGLWRGTSVCTDRVLAPACRDETVVYEFSAGPDPAHVHWIADKVVNGARDRMGELDLAFDPAERCWKVEFSSPRMKSVWRLVAEGAHLSGTARLLPGGQVIRRVDLRRE
ncbi:MAG: hypothetical protein U0599_07110 [Vicinamibacteria bacterium]